MTEKEFIAAKVEKLIKSLKEFPKDFIGAEMLKYKSYTMIFPFEEKKLFSPNFRKTILEVFKAMTPLNHFINRTF